VVHLCIIKVKANVSIGLNDIFETMCVGFEGRLQCSQNGKLYCEIQTVQLVFNYRFGSSNFQTKSRRERDRDQKSSGSGKF
jgi:hypothetical protein